ncbi:HAD family hydrolase [Bradyrhizobium sp. AUGA SZCCT0283]|uniref:HAD family hydrolase n=1 Tax=Bradyrhizobium sp. AUGA SZCCT0283 TaxID=2807671 RepID=UPI001BA4FA1E|nr:HAD family hydrolase [Bradyrhizobium sp. AUGA SZCCT0283]MBR1277483.1 HAD family hydrolase [Bradyrhizobium sp. AUGA SZCCT0283]
MYELRSVDIWDTLLRRTCHPEAVKLSLAKHVFLRFNDRLTNPTSDHWELYQERLAVEREIGRRSTLAGYDDEYNLLDVCREWVESTLAISDSGEAAELAEELAEFELSLELECSYVDREISEFLRGHPAKRTIYLSDFYMPSSMVARLLQSKGIHELVPDGFVSCDVQQNKRSGGLFLHAQKSLGIRPEHHLHIGDNMYSDVEVARSLGVAAVHFSPASAGERRCRHEIAFGSREALFEHLAAETENLAIRETSTDQPSRSAAFRAGVRAAPLFLGFCLFVAERAILDKVDRLFFLSQEGEFFHRVFATVFPQNVLSGLRLPESGALAVSRLSTFSASLAEKIGIDELMLVWTLQWQQRASTLFQILGLDARDFNELLSSLKISANELLVHPEDDPRVRQLLDSEIFREAALRECGKRRTLLGLYLQEQGFTGQRKIGVVDIGWRGTIQDNLARIYPSTHFAGYYLGLRSFLNAQQSNVEKVAYGPDEQNGSFTELFDSFEPLEIICSSATGSTEGYDLIYGMPVPLKSIHATAEKPGFPQHFQDGVVFAAQQWGPALLQYAVMSSEMRVIGMRIWEHLTRSPPQGLVQTFLEVPQHDVFGFGGYFDRGQPPSIKEMFFGVFNRKIRNDVILYIRKTQWVPAIERQPGVSNIHKLILRLLFFLAHKYKLRKIRYQKQK